MWTKIYLPKAGSCEQGTERSGSIKYWKFLDYIKISESKKGLCAKELITQDPFNIILPPMSLFPKLSKVCRLKFCMHFESC
jgi:hypothetical protein